MNHSDIHRLTLDDKEIILVGTAHISRESVDTVTRVIAEEQPDTVCIELDEQRFQALKNTNKWESLNLKEVIRKGQVPFLMTNLALAAFQKRMGLQTGIRPGAEMAAAADAAAALGARVELVDRNIRTTLLRVWRRTSLWKKAHIMATLVASLFESQKASEEELARLRQTDTLSAMLEEMSRMLPSVKSVLVDERDIYMAYHIRNAPGRRIVAVLGAAHIPGIKRLFGEDISAATIAEISRVPPKPIISRAIPWIIPAVVISLFVLGFFLGDRQQVAGAALAWVLANGGLSALGALLALGHPLTVASAFFAAPLTSLNPTVGAGFVTGLVQVMVAAPTVRDMERVGDDLVSVRGWWSNRLARVLLVFVFSSLGSTLGTFLAFHWLKDLI
ncbi:TraB/GumN family protein [Geoalkalibacter halelectricus]|uniref:TraB/GumN family protein n=1 Tax=Geoalkalibacter halelectricus TaxID=2847045 RepID=A0ABY5ZQ37_9BACT|nr:TraB/GumN family protein [Geoalkalibacter halelectricus]MDO3376989.1 TraB/GumN family protein [Geoalkalibacter halelectricus]UWZ81211.1 TraB/GumN family protein [Geoalkalibacter halelectricus]